MSDTVEACPECDSTNLRNTVGHHYGTDAGHDGYACNECEATFAEPTVREGQNRNHCRNGLAAKLADPDVDDPTDIVTDGGRNYSDTQFTTTESTWYDCPNCGSRYRNKSAAADCTGCSE